MSFPKGAKEMATKKAPAKKTVKKAAKPATKSPKAKAKK